QFGGTSVQSPLRFPSSRIGVSRFRRQWHRVPRVPVRKEHGLWLTPAPPRTERVFRNIPDKPPAASPGHLSRRPVATGYPADKRRLPPYGLPSIGSIAFRPRRRSR